MMENLSIIQNQIRLTVLVLASIAVIFGFRKYGMKVYQTTLIMAILSPFLYGFIKQLPLWIFIPAVIIIIGLMFKKIVGNEAFGHFFGAIHLRCILEITIDDYCRDREKDQNIIQ